jgi:hypothetical protein
MSASCGVWAPPLLRPATYLEPFALRGLGVVREKTTLIEEAASHFERIGLDWHAAETRTLGDRIARI